MNSQPIMITGPPGSGKTRIAIAIMSLFADGTVITNCTDTKKLAAWSTNKTIKLVVIEGIEFKEQMEAIHSHFNELSTAFLVFTTQQNIEAPKGFSVIECTN